MKISVIVACLSFLLVSCSSMRPVTATSNKVGDLKGEACQKNLFFLIPLSNDASIHTAATKVGMKEISTVDSSSFVSIVYNEFCTVVHGNK